MSTVQGLKDIVRTWQGKRIGVIGDVMLDHYIEGEVTRISPEAPVPIVKVVREWFAPGGAANVAANIAALGGEVELYGVIGVDEAGDQLVHELKKRGVSFRALCSPDRPTTEKTRILARNQQLARIDREVCGPISDGMGAKILQFVETLIRSWAGIILSDYDKGMLTPSLTEHIICCAGRHNKPIIGDAKPQNIKAFRGATVLTPNETEMRAILRVLHLYDFCAAAKALESSLLVTRGDVGCVVVDENSSVFCPTIPRDVFDMVGAGDTVVAVVSLALASGVALVDAARIANVAAGIVVGKHGTATVSADELIGSLDEIEEVNGSEA